MAGKVPQLIAKLKINIEKNKLVDEMSKTSMKAFEQVDNNMQKKTVDVITTKMKELDKIITSSTDFGEIKSAMGEKNNLQKDLDKEQGTKKESPLLKGFGKIAGTLLQMSGLISIGIGIISAVKALFDPVKNILSSFFKMTAEFFRPIGDMLMFMFQPLLLMMKPIVQAFRVLMLPFKQIAMKGMAAANSLIVMGQRTGGEAGGAMISAGFEGAMSSVSLLLSGFMQATIGKLFGGIEAFGIGQAITDTFDNWESSALAGVMKVSEKADLVRELGDNVAEFSGEGLISLFNIIDVAVEELKTNVGQFTVENFTKDLAAVSIELDKLFVPLAEDLKSGQPLDVALLNFHKNINTLSGAFSLTADAAYTAAHTIADTWMELKKITAETGVAVGERGLINKIEGAEGTTFLNKVWDNIVGSSYFIKEFLAGDKIGTELSKRQAEWGTADEKIKVLIDNQLLRFEDYYKERGIKEGKGLAESLGYVDEYLGTSLIPDSFKTGMIHMHLDVDRYFNPASGLTISTTKTGFASMQEAAQQFSVSMSSIAESIKNSARDAANYASQARASASSAKKTTSKLTSSWSSY